MKADYHVHTVFSDDSDYLMEQIVQDAIEQGLDEVCFTDHVDYGVKNDWGDGEKIKYRKGMPGEPENMPVLNVNYPLYYVAYQKVRKLYHELGGRVLTIGSDSHKPEHLGAFIDETRQELKMLGFKEFCTFDKMKPIYHRL